MRKSNHVVISLLLALTLIAICSGCQSPTTSTVKDAKPETTSPPTLPSQPTAPMNPQTPSANQQPVTKAPTKYTIKNYSKSDTDTQGFYFYTFYNNTTGLINYKTPTAPFTIQKLVILGLIVGNDKREFASQTFDIKIWDKYGSKELWSKNYPYTNFSLDIPKWVTYDVPNIKVGESFVLEFIPNASQIVVGTPPNERISWKCGLGVAADFDANVQTGQTTSKGVIMPWGDSTSAKRLQNAGWMVRIEGEG